MSKTELRYEFASSGAARVRKDMQGVQQSQTELGKTFDTSGANMLIMAQKIQMAAAAAKKAWDFARQGAQARDIARQFAALGDAVPKIEALREASRNLIDDTSLQQVSHLAAQAGLSADAMEGLTARIAQASLAAGKGAEAQRFLEAAVKGQTATLKEIGIVIDTSDESMKGMTRTQKALQLATELGAEGLRAMGDEVVSSEGKMIALETQFANLKSSAQEQFSVMLESSGIMEEMSGIMATLGEVMGDASDNGVGQMIAQVLALVSPLIEIAQWTNKFANQIGELVEAINPFDVAMKALGVELGGFGEIVNDIVMPALTAITDAMSWATDGINAMTGSLLGSGKAADEANPIFLRFIDSFRAITDEAAANRRAVNEARAAVVDFDVATYRAEGAVSSLKEQLAKAQETFRSYHDSAVPKGVAEKFAKDHLAMAQSVAGLERQQVMALQTANEYWAAVSGTATAEQIAQGMALTDASIRATARLVEAQGALVQMGQLVEATTTGAGSASKKMAAEIEESFAPIIFLRFGDELAYQAGRMSDVFAPLAEDVLEHVGLMTEWHAANEALIADYEQLDFMMQNRNMYDEQSIYLMHEKLGLLSAEERAVGRVMTAAQKQAAQQRAAIEEQIAMLGGYTQIGAQVFDLLDKVSEGSAIATWGRAIMGSLEAAGAMYLAIATGNIPGAVSAGISIANYLAAAAMAESRGASGGAKPTAGAGGVPSVSSGMADLPAPSAMPAGREHTSTTVVMRWGDRVLGEAVIGSVNRAARDSSQKIDRELIGTASSRRGVL
jgi:hypothetical protein